MGKYCIDTDNDTAVIAMLVRVFQKENPSVGKMRVVCHDGTKVIFWFPNPDRIQEKKR